MSGFDRNREANTYNDACNLINSIEEVEYILNKKILLPRSMLPQLDELKKLKDWAKQIKKNCLRNLE